MKKLERNPLTWGERVIREMYDISAQSWLHFQVFFSSFQTVAGPWCDYKTLLVCWFRIQLRFYIDET